MIKGYRTDKCTSQIGYQDSLARVLTFEQSLGSSVTGLAAPGFILPHQKVRIMLSKTVVQCSCGWLLGLLIVIHIQQKDSASHNLLHSNPQQWEFPHPGALLPRTYAY